LYQVFIIADRFLPDCQCYVVCSALRGMGELNPLANSPEIHSFFWENHVYDVPDLMADNPILSMERSFKELSSK
jgi:hypothetical protein